jgi:hypothetical protein
MTTWGTQHRPEHRSRGSNSGTIIVGTRHHAAGADVVPAVTTRPAAGSNDSDDITHLAPFPRGRV